MKSESTLKEKTPHEASPLSRWAGSLLLAAALFAIAATVTFGSIGKDGPVGWAFAGLGLLCLLGWFLGRRAQERATPDQFARQRTRLGTDALVSSALVFAVLIGLNYIAARRHYTFDLTSNRINSLSDQTQRTLEKLPAPVTMTYIFSGSGNAPRDAGVTSLLDAYRNASSKVRVEYLNALRDPLQVRNLNLSTLSQGTGFTPVLLLRTASQPTAKATDQSTSAGENRQEIAVVDEQNITSALLKLIDPRPRTLYFLAGHGELSPNVTGASAPSPLTLMQLALTAQNYALRPLSLQKKDAKIPNDASAVLIMGPQVDLTANEEKVLRNYLLGRGRVVLMIDAPRTKLPGWNRVLGVLGLSIGDGLVIDPQQVLERGKPSILAVQIADVTAHPILRGVSGAVVMPGALPLLSRGNPLGGLNSTTLLEASTRSGIARTNGEAAQVFQGANLPPSRRGPFVLATALERNARVVVTGSASLATDPFWILLGNNSFVLSSINWVAGQETLVSIPPKPPVTNTLSMPDNVRRFTAIFSLFALPVTLLLLGGMVWWKRR
ncbi:MAG: gliding motility-associatede transport system auxiliary component [Abditibacteriota bacterium]|nr:gliding motility-associatede transport system auxiliary component [Abditibacteriota bacterium]